MILRIRRFSLFWDSVDRLWDEHYPSHRRRSSVPRRTFQRRRAATVLPFTGKQRLVLMHISFVHHECTIIWLYPFLR